MRSCVLVCLCTININFITALLYSLLFTIQRYNLFITRVSQCKCVKMRYVKINITINILIKAKCFICWNSYSNSFVLCQVSHKRKKHKRKKVINHFMNVDVETIFRWNMQGSCDQQEACRISFLTGCVLCCCSSPNLHSWSLETDLLYFFILKMSQSIMIDNSNMPKRDFF